MASQRVWSTSSVIAAELRGALGPRGPWRAAALLLIFVVAGTFLLRNVATMHLFGFTASHRWTPFTTALADLLATYYYALPVVALRFGHDVFTSGEQYAGAEPVGVRSRRLLGAVVVSRALYVALLIAATFAAGFVAVAARGAAAGAAPGTPEAGRALLGLASVELAGLTLFGLVAAVAAPARDPGRAMLYGAALVTFSIVGVTILSDMVLYYSTGPMAVPGTSQYMDYIAQSSSRTGLEIYLLSPTEAFLTMATFQAGLSSLSAAAVETAFRPLLLQAAAATLVAGTAVWFAPPFRGGAAWS